ncbi:MAG: prephenate dehydrogenase/arogenate dehydrogenase family protein, partial [bacterium]
NHRASRWQKMAVAFEKMAIVGLGLIGGSLAAALKRQNACPFIVGVDDEVAVQKAKEKKLIDDGVVRERLPEAVENVDLIVLATPIAQIIDLLKSLPVFIKPGVLITDVGSTKQVIVETARRHLPRDVYFLGGHPMTGSEKTGIEHADSFLFENAVYVLSKTERVPETLVNDFASLLNAIGAHVFHLDPKTHDEIAALVSHVPQILAVILMNCVAKRNASNPNYFKLAAGGFRDMTRIASSPFAIWEDICQSNAKNIEQGLSLLIKEMTDIGDRLTRGELRSAFEQAVRARRTIPKDTRGFMRPYFDITVVVEDKPGMIATIANLLAEANINIKDIEILKIREGEGGAMRLAVESESDRSTALKTLNQNGFAATKR